MPGQLLMVHEGFQQQRIGGTTAVTCPKWNTDPFTSNQCSTTLREVSPTIDNNVDGSNYDPDSDWDVSDAEVDIVEDHGEDAFEAKAPIQRMRDTKNNTADCGAIRIW